MKKSLFYMLVVLIIALLAFSGCSSSTEAKDTNIKGYVYDANGEPVADAGILLSYNTDIELERPGINIRFSLSQDCDVKLWVTKQAQQDTVKLIFDCEMDAGAHSVEWNAKNTAGLQVVNTYYDFHFTAMENHMVRTVLLNQKGYISSTEYEFSAVTDQDGFFSLSQDYLPFNSLENSVDYYNEDGIYIGIMSVNRYVSVWALHPDFDIPVSVDSIYVNENESTIVELNFPAE
jgi:methionine-rich copper-binding protein CopC